MSQGESYFTTVEWKGEHLGRLSFGNGPEMDFSAPPDAHGPTGVLTPEEAFVAAVNSCIMLMFLWSCERFKIALLSYTCRAEGIKITELDKTESFREVRLFPEIRVNAAGSNPANLEARILRALESAQKYSLVANSIKSTMKIEPMIEIIT